MDVLKNGTDAYSIIGNKVVKYICNSNEALDSDYIVKLKINGIVSNELMSYNPSYPDETYWNLDWWEGEENIEILGIIPVHKVEVPNNYKEV